MDLQGIAALITALTGVASLGLTAIIILRLAAVHKLVNSNFTNLDARLQQSLEINRQQTEATSGNPPTNQLKPREP